MDQVCEYLHAEVVVRMYADLNVQVKGSLDQIVDALRSVDGVAVATGKRSGPDRRDHVDLPYYGTLSQRGLV